MARTLITPVANPNNANASAVPALLTWQAADISNNNNFASTGAERLLVWNSGASAYTVTVHSQPDTFGRVGDITAFSIPAGAYYDLGLFPVLGWRQADGTIWVDASNIAIKFIVLTG